MGIKQRVFYFIARERLRFIRGMVFINLVWAILNFLVFVKVWQSTFEWLGIDFTVLLVSGPVAFVASGWLVGYLDEKLKFWRYEWEHQIEVQNKEYWDLINDVKEIRNILESQNVTAAHHE